MTNLPITSNASQSANAAGATKGNNAAADPAADAQAAEPFASLLARQISGSISPGTGIAQIAIAAGVIDPELKDAQDQIDPATDTTADPTDALSAVLLQIPQEMRTSFSSEATSSTTGKQNSPGIGIATRKTASLADAMLDVADMAQGKADALSAAQGKTEALSAALNKTDALLTAQGKADALSVAQGKTEISAVATDRQIIADAMNQGAFKRAELSSSMSHQPTQNTAQAINPSATPPMMPNALADGKISSSPQTIAAPFGSSGWANDFSQKISWMSTQQNQVAELHLNPPDLGPLNVVLKISDNQATALFTSPHSAVRDAVENAIPKLRELLADNGIMLGNATVSDQSPRDRGADEFMNRGLSTAAQRETSDDALKSATLSLSQNVPMHRHNGMVDTFA